MLRKIGGAAFVRTRPSTAGAGRVPEQSSVAAETNNNTLIYLLWALGFVGTAGVAVTGYVLPIADRDFTQFWVAGKLATSGHIAQIYDTDSFRAAAAAMAGTKYKIAFRYPPTMLFLCVAFSVFPLTVGFYAWAIVSAFLFHQAARPYLPATMPTFLAVVTPSAMVSVIFGQNGLFFGALWLFAFRGSALAAALLTIKPNIGFLVAFEMFRRRLIVNTAVMALGITVLSLLFFGWTGLLHSVHPNAPGVFSLGEAGKFMNVYVQMTTPYTGYGYVGWFAFATAAALMLMHRFDVFTAATATFLISPYGFHYDMAVVCLGFGVLLFRSWRTLPPYQTIVAALAFLSPMLVRAGTWLVPPLLLAGLYVQIRAPYEGQGRAQVGQ